MENGHSNTCHKGGTLLSEPALPWWGIPLALWLCDTPSYRSLQPCWNIFQANWIKLNWIISPKGPGSKHKESVKSPTSQQDVSENSGTPKSSILIGFSIINHPFWGTPIFGNTQHVHFRLHTKNTTHLFPLLSSFSFLLLTWAKAEERSYHFFQETEEFLVTCDIFVEDIVSSWNHLKHKQHLVAKCTVESTTYTNKMPILVW